MAKDTVKGRAPVLWFALPAAMVLLGIGGLWRGGAWAWLGIAQLPVLALIDTLLGPDTRPRAALSPALAETPFSTFKGPKLLCKSLIASALPPSG